MTFLRIDSENGVLVELHVEDQGFLHIEIDGTLALLNVEDVHHLITYLIGVMELTNEPS